MSQQLGNTHLTAEIDALVMRLMTLTVPDREIDFRIALLVDGFLNAKGKDMLRRALAGESIGPAATVSIDEVVPRFTESVDAAMRLIDKGWSIDLSITNAGRKDMRSRVTMEAPRRRAPHRKADGDASLPAIALCVAALKMQLAGRPQGDFVDG